MTDDLLDGHKIESVQSGKFGMYDILVDGKGEGKLSVTGITIYDLDGNDVTSNYKIKYDYVKDIKVEYAPLIIDLETRDLTIKWQKEWYEDVESGAAVEDILRDYLLDNYDMNSLIYPTGLAATLDGHFFKYTGTKFKVTKVSELSTYRIEFSTRDDYGFYCEHPLYGFTDLDACDLIADGWAEINEEDSDVYYSYITLTDVQEDWFVNLPTLTFRYEPNINTSKVGALETVIDAAELPEGMSLTEGALEHTMEDAVGTYTYTINKDSIDGTNPRYNLIINPGTVIVEKKTIEIRLPNYVYEYSSEKDLSDVLEQIVSDVKNYSIEVDL